MSQNRLRGWALDLVVGGLLGVIVGWIVVVNLVIYLGVPEGYEAGPGDVFAHSVVLGVLLTLVLVSGPVIGVVLARRRRRAQTDGESGRRGDTHVPGSS